MIDKPISIALAQLNSHLGNIAANVECLIDAREKANAGGADIIVTPEMFLSGYPCDDLVLRSDFMHEVAAGIARLTQVTADGGAAIIVGAPYREQDGDVVRIYNSVFVLDDGKIIGRRDKVNLPNYGVFDDKRNFTAGAMPGPVLVRGLKLGLPVCEDIWTPDVVECLQESGADMIVSLNASPFDSRKNDQRMAHAVSRTIESSLPLLYVNLIGGQDELVFDGGSFALNADGNLATHLPSFSQAVVQVQVKSDFGALSLTGQITPPDEDLAAIYRGLMLGVRDYVQKNGFPGVVLGLSGGIDSALVAAIAADALGADAVHAVMMPSPYTSDESLEDAADLASRFGMRLDTISIGPAMAAMDEMLADQFAGKDPDIAEENIQSRLRGTILMGISNKNGAMVMATGNKSEYAAGYSTLYGDMCGGFAPIKDVWKVQVFDLCHWRNANLPRGAAGPEGEVIPKRIIDKPPSAELRPDQKDTDSLPPYERLDAIMQALTEDAADIDAIVAQGYDIKEVAQASQLLFRAEFKRFQAAPGPKMTSIAFGRDRRLPLTSGFSPLKTSMK
ncbi:NAD+ synthase [Candidatus Puniceispirillum marinum]|uniref:Glutamine-dependent NAD(+) synthetase n=1 Tax=Puniceispirillum marinum (strain IMCC1322) TaxID=488538 RepID=D5BRM6_PUNMI|nr:NAD+ synthase [Candidatus Puniceispirillum marinum]ADE38923.1 Glutamine-dependent NAD(+) synthetase [Candidatus Puniceispirillum marinum IMCC1322]